MEKKLYDMQIKFKFIKIPWTGLWLNSHQYTK